MAEIGIGLDGEDITIYGLLAAIESRGYIYQEGGRGVRKMGVKILGLREAYDASVELRPEAQPSLLGIDSVVDQAVYRAILRGYEVDPMCVRRGDIACRPNSVQARHI